MSLKPQGVGVIPETTVIRGQQVIIPPVVAVKGGSISHGQPPWRSSSL